MRLAAALTAAGAALSLLGALTGCATGSLAPAVTTPSATAAGSSTTPVAGPTVIVTVPDLLLTTSASALPTVEPAPVAPPAVEGATEPPADEAAAAAAADPADDAAVEAPEPPSEPPRQPPAGAPAEATPPVAAPAPEPAAAPSGAGLNVSLANCDGCTVLATHRGVTGELSAALVRTGSGRAVLLSVATDGQATGVIGVPYGAAFAAPSGGVLACAQGRCVVEGRQSDGRAILSAFELTGTGAWRDVSGDDAFPSATEQAAVIDLDGELGIAVQDQGNGAAVWMLYTWGGDRFAVVGCAADGAVPSSIDAVSPAACLS